MATLKLKSGDDNPVKFVITDSDGDAVNLTGGTIKFKIAKTRSTTDANAEYFGEYTSFTSAVTGTHIETIPDATSKDWTPDNYIFQSRFEDSEGLVQSEDVDICEIEENAIDDE
ncbi:MAG: hypothetical protein V3V72_13725 [Ignavibacteriaceae bacterium]